MGIDQIIKPDTFGFIAAALTTIAFLPQVIKTWRTKKAEDVSIVMLLMFITGLLFWIVYAIQTNALPVLIANIITFILNVTILTLKLIYGKQPSSTQRTEQLQRSAICCQEQPHLRSFWMPRDGTADSMQKEIRQSCIRKGASYDPLITSLVIPITQLVERIKP